MVDMKETEVLYRDEVVSYRQTGQAAPADNLHWFYFGSQQHSSLNWLWNLSLDVHESLSPTVWAHVTTVFPGSRWPYLRFVWLEENQTPKFIKPPQNNTITTVVSMIGCSIFFYQKHFIKQIKLTLSVENWKLKIIN